MHTNPCILVLVILWLSLCSDSVEDGKVFMWGGSSSHLLQTNDMNVLPYQVTELDSLVIIDASVGDTHALFADGVHLIITVIHLVRSLISLTRSFLGSSW
jgi:hypothetical protein